MTHSDDATRNSPPWRSSRCSEWLIGPSVDEIGILASAAINGEHTKLLVLPRALHLVDSTGCLRRPRDPTAAVKISFIYSLLFIPQLRSDANATVATGG